ncbi:hypothetical protein BDB00DRAFT_816573 [Zychaea mexicana]|uniref:uncharacterized protein n=1 Tax=Zychaea mexicana TaxID=64656 RepID=UPI0022FE6E99|nr:uncharacterized protein BDB00DRAFT_816573 [Zychaea mexicana]KAI9494984.1 hypothetical protein BDB00DRAFT_816573 [Zychaea mexicana]
MLDSVKNFFSDITVNVPAVQKSYALHSLILTRSPVLYRHLLGLSVHQPPLVMDLDIVASPETIHTVIGHLYRPLTQQDLFFIVNEKPQLCFDLLDATQELELQSLQRELVYVMGQSFNQNTILYWISALLSSSSQQQLPPPPPPPHHHHHQHRSQPRRLWADLLDHHIVQYLVSGLPRQLNKQPPPTSSCDNNSKEHDGGDNNESAKVNFGTCVHVADPTGGWHNTVEEWARLYAELPLEYLKRCLEHSDLMVKDTVERYKFAKQVLEFREQLGKCGLTVLLQFCDSNNDCGILVVKKQASKFGKWDPSRDSSI